jgi:hypothetical protein
MAATGATEKTINKNRWLLEDLAKPLSAGIDPAEARNVSLFSSEDFENMPPLDTEDALMILPRC